LCFWNEVLRRFEEHLEGFSVFLCCYLRPNLVSVLLVFGPVIKLSSYGDGIVQACLYFFDEDADLSEHLFLCLRDYVYFKDTTFKLARNGRCSVMGADNEGIRSLDLLFEDLFVKKKTLQWAWYVDLIDVVTRYAFALELVKSETGVYDPDMEYYDRDLFSLSSDHQYNKLWEEFEGSDVVSVGGARLPVGLLMYYVYNVNDIFDREVNRYQFCDYTIEEKFLRFYNVANISTVLMKILALRKYLDLGCRFIIRVPVPYSRALYAVLGHMSQYLVKLIPSDDYLNLHMYLVLRKGGKGPSYLDRCLKKVLYYMIAGGRRNARTVLGRRDPNDQKMRALWDEIENVPLNERLNIEEIHGSDLY